VTPSAPASQRARTGSVRIGTEVIPEGVPVPRGTLSVGTPHSFVDGHLRGWETALDLGGVPAATALAELRADLAAQGFDVRTGSLDVFGARLRSGRWEIVVARAQTRLIDHRTRQVLMVGVGSRAA
jgi:hypothetical protein